jgi:membrane protein
VTSDETRTRRLARWLFEGDLPERPQALRAVAMGVRLLALAGLRFHRDRGQEKAAGLAYSTLLALIPFLVLSVSFLEFLAPSDRTNLAEWVVRNVFPAEARQVRDGVLDYIDKSRTAMQTADAAGTGLRIFSAGMLLYFGLRLLAGIDGVVGAVWGTGSFRALVRRLTAYWAVLTLGPLLLAASIAGTAIARDAMPVLGGFLSTALPFLVTWIAWFAFYRLMPHSGARSTAALAGALTAGSAWEGTKLVMGWYLASPKTLLTALGFFPAALLWMYISWVIAIYGLEVTYVVHHGSWRAGRRAGLRSLLGRPRDELMLATAVEVAWSFDEGGRPSLAALAERLRCGEDEVADVLQALCDARILTTDDDGGVRPARGAGAVPAVDVVAVSRLHRTAVPAAASPAACVAREFLDSLDERGRAAVESTSIEDLARRSHRRNGGGDS